MPPRIANDASGIRTAASLIIVRDGVEGLEVLMLRRSDTNDQNSRAWVFPGGILEEQDIDLAEQVYRPYGDGTAREIIANVDARRVTAIREAFEETGVLFADSGCGNSPLEMAVMRREINSRNRLFKEIVAHAGLRLSLMDLLPLAHWITPPGMPKRFDTLFFVASLPVGQRCEVDGFELMEHIWVSPRNDSLLRKIKVLNVTQTILREVRGFSTTRDLFCSVRGAAIRTQLPRRCIDTNGIRTVRQDHPAWEEIGLLDAQGAGDISCEMHAGLVTNIHSRLIRVWSHSDAPTAMWILTTSEGECVIIDPGPTEQCSQVILRHCAHKRIAAVLFTSNMQPIKAQFAHAIGPNVPVIQSQFASPGQLSKFELALWENDSGYKFFFWPQERILFWPGGQDDAIRYLQGIENSGVRWVAPSQGFLTSIRGTHGHTVA